ncbi:hypothetical protein [Porphyromonas sp.]
MILRVHSDQNSDNNNKDGWAATSTLTEEQIATIIDPAGGDPKLDVTSIPSPWGRWDLIRTAFRNVTSTGDFDKNKLDHKLISDTLDVAQIFFHLDRLKKQGVVEVLCWNREKELDSLLESDLSGHQILGKALDKYLSQDAKSFNFDKLSSIALLLVVDPKTGEKTIVGSTSSVTLFSIAPGDLSHLSSLLNFGTDRPFDKELCPLYKREEAFIIWLYALQSGYAYFSRYFKEIDEYLNATKSLLPKSIQRQINALTPESLQKDYDLQEYMPGSPIAILEGFNLFTSKGTSVEKISEKSDFCIRPRRKDREFLPERLPLVLPDNAGYGSLYYIVDRWDTETEVPTCDPLPLNQRRLPGSGELYPYLSIGDFLEDNIVTLYNEIREDCFYPGERSLSLKNAKLGCMLPLKPRFFDYFSTDDLVNYKMLEMDLKGEDIIVKLSIPIKGGKMVYERTYSKETEDAAVGANQPAYCRKKYRFELGMIPTKRHQYLCYVAAKNLEASLGAFVASGELVAPSYSSTQEIGKREIYSQEYAQHLEMLRVTLSGVSGILIPIPRKPSTSQASVLSYAVDLGTTNTVVACKEDDGTPALLSWKDSEILRMLTDFQQSYEGKLLIESRLTLPYIGGTGPSDIDPGKFQFRTALRVNQDDSGYHGPFSNSAPDFTYQRFVSSGGGLASDTKLDIKWEGVNDYSLRSYIHSLCVLISAHAELRGAPMLRLSWSYPSSMNSQDRNRLTKLWESAVNEYLEVPGDRKVELISENEAVAPYLYYYRTAGIQGRTVSMDIGGGTVDILLTGYTEGEPMHLSSCGLGGNTLLREPYNKQTQGSGFSNYLRDYVDDVLKSGKVGDPKAKGHLDELLKWMQDNVERGKTVEAVEKFFALAQFVSMQEYRKALNLDLAEILTDESIPQSNLRSIVLLYFVSLIYYTALLVKDAELPLPDSFVFSGNGSRMLRVVGDDGLLSAITTEIFKVVIGKDAAHPSQKIGVMYSEEPKLATTYGMLYREGSKGESPESLLSVHQGKLLRGGDVPAVWDADERSAHQEDYLAKMLEDVASLANLFKHVTAKLRLVKEYGYTDISIKFILDELADVNANDGLIRGRLFFQLEKEEEIAEGLLPMFVSLRIPQISLSMHKQLKSAKVGE